MQEYCNIKRKKNAPEGSLLFFDIEKKLSNQGFVSKAPAAVVEGEKAKMEKYRENLAGVVAALAKLG